MIALLREFANTYREWHYLAVGFSYGMLAGYILRGLVIRTVSDPYEL